MLGAGHDELSETGASDGCLDGVAFLSANRPHLVRPTLEAEWSLDGENSSAAQDGASKWVELGTVSSAGNGFLGKV